MLQTMLEDPIVLVDEDVSDVAVVVQERAAPRPPPSSLTISSSAKILPGFDFEMSFQKGRLKDTQWSSTPV